MPTYLVCVYEWTYDVCLYAFMNHGACVGAREQLESWFFTSFPSIWVLGLKLKSSGLCESRFTAIASRCLLISTFLMLLHSSGIANLQHLSKYSYLGSLSLFMIRNNSLMVTTVQFCPGVSLVRIPKCIQVLHSASLCWLVTHVRIQALKMERYWTVLELNIPVRMITKKQLKIHHMENISFWRQSPIL